MSTRRDPLVVTGLAVVTIAAAVSSFGALDGTARLAGWTPKTAVLLPVTVDATAAVATRIWLSAETNEKARRFARSVAFGAIIVSLLGNGVFHLAEAGYLAPGVWLVIAAGGISPLALAVVAHLAVLRGATVPEVPARVEPPLPVQAPAPLPVVESVPTPTAPAAIPEKPKAALPPAPKKTEKATPALVDPAEQKSADDRSWADLLEAAREVDAATRKSAGRAAGVGRLKAELGVGQTRAQQLRDALAAVPEPA